MISQNPAGGTTAAPGTAVDLVVSTGRAPVSVPDVVGLTQASGGGDQGGGPDGGHGDDGVRARRCRRVAVISQNPAGGDGCAAGHGGGPGGVDWAGAGERAGRGGPDAGDGGGGDRGGGSDGGHGDDGVERDGAGGQRDQPEPGRWHRVRCRARRWTWWCRLGVRR